MSKYEEIYEAAADNYGLVTRDEAAAMGVSDKELSRLTSDGKLTRIGHGVYRVKHHVPSPFDPYAESVAAVGPDAYLYGESVLAMLSLCPTNPTKMFVATPKRVRRKLPEGMKVVQRKGASDVTCYEGIPSQEVGAAIRSCVGKLMPERLHAAVEEALRQGLLKKEEADRVDSEVESCGRRGRTVAGIWISRSSALPGAARRSSKRGRSWRMPSWRRCCPMGPSRVAAP